jgi:predicted PurR-regulated permease PerM
VTRLAVTGALVALGLWILWDFVPALAWATVFAVATWPLYTRFVQFVHGDRHPSVLAPLAFTILVGLVFLVPLALATLELGREALFVARFLPSIDETGLPVPAWLAEIPRLGPYVATWWQANLADPHAATALLGRLDRGVMIEWIQTLGRQLARRSTVLIFTLLSLFFLYRDGRGLVSDLEALTVRLVGPQGRRVGIQMVQAVRGTVNGLVLVGLAEGVVLGFAYVLLGLPHAMIPFGAPVIFGVGALVLLSQSGVVSAIILLVIGAVVVFVADHFVRPVLIGGAVKLPFLWVLLGILGGLEGFGLLGLFLGPTVMAALIALWREWIVAAREPETLAAD